ncbi:MAG: flavin reductase [Rhodocyclaceae bacterium]|nr:MAG: flavin reductase [Rhodocyclaceae bacterium]
MESAKRISESNAMVDSAAYRSGMRLLAAGVSIIASRHEAEKAGLTATAVCSITADPPKLLVCVNKSVAASSIIEKSGKLSVNVLSGNQEATAKRFAGMIDGVRGESRFEDGAWDVLETGAPVLNDALVSFDCRVVGILEESTHKVFFAEVVAVKEKADAEALVYLNGKFQTLKTHFE